ncbi:MAG: DNA-binding protein [Chloroflexi bacterium HGW-Chloroflexi-5]|jgi:excisionase family DNA binding protein|nr:MAG: DNA-binding protein [Chloroflexi bacterium HGW-Chloroflexi-5]
MEDDFDINRRLLKASEVAAQLNISRTLAYRMMQNGEITTVRFLGSVRVQYSDLMEFITIHRSPENNTGG